VEEAAVGRGTTRETWIGLATTGFAVGTMAVDHLLGESDDEDGAALDYPAFAISTVLCVAVAGLLFGRVVPRARARGPERAATIGLLWSALGIVPGVLVLWLGFPFVVAGAGIALGIVGLTADRRAKAIAAIVLGTLLLAFGAVYYLSAVVESIG
jgi:hypothetical protein